MASPEYRPVRSTASISSGCACLATGPSAYAALATTALVTTSGRSATSCSSNEPPVLCPMTGTGPPKRSRIATACRSATSANVVAGSIPGQRLTKKTS